LCPGREEPVAKKMACDLLVLSEVMGWICEHCSAPFEAPAYRVKSEESGVLLLNMIVCHSCRIAAQELGLHTEELSVESFLKAKDDIKKKDVSS
jgi:hypothetical protein